MRIDAKGKKGPILNLSAPGQWNASYPQVATAANGASTITWVSEGSKYAISAVRIDAKGKKGPILKLTAPGQSAYEPRVATAPNGTSTIAWQRYAGKHYVIQAVRIDAKGKKGPILSLSAPGQGANGQEVATAPNGTSTIAWQRYGGSTPVIQAVRIDAKGKKGPVLSLSAPGRMASVPQVATAANGASTITWQQRRDVGTNIDIQAVRIDAEGNKGTVLDISSDVPNSEPGIQVATGLTGASVVTWTGYAGKHYVIQAALLP